MRECRSDLASCRPIELLRRCPDLLEMRKTAGRLELALGRPEAAVAEFALYFEAVDRSPDSGAMPSRPAFETASVHAAMAEVLRALGREDEAEHHTRLTREMTIERLKASLAINPDAEALRTALERFTSEADDEEEVLFDQ